MTIEELLKKYEIKDLETLEKILSDYDDNCLVITIIYAYLNAKGLTKDFQNFVNILSKGAPKNVA